MTHPLNAYLKKAKITQTQLASDLGISRAHLSYVLSGKRRLGINIAIIASRKLGIPLERFFQ